MNTWDGVTLQLHNYLALATRVAQGSTYVQAMASAFGNTTDPTSDKYFRLKDLEETGWTLIFSPPILYDPLTDPPSSPSHHLRID